MLAYMKHAHAVQLAGLMKHVTFHLPTCLALAV
jgi:hypothetical protein